MEVDKFFVLTQLFYVEPSYLFGKFDNMDMIKAIVFEIEYKHFTT